MKSPQHIKALVAPNDPKSVSRSYFAVRLALGSLGLILPLILCAHGFMAKAPFPTSVSHFYHTAVGDIFVGCLCAIGMFLIAYQDPTPDEESQYWIPLNLDWVLSSVAGIGAIGVALAPVDPILAKSCLTAIGEHAITCRPTGFTGLGEFAGFKNGYHYAFAFCFFLFIMLICLIVLPRSPGAHGPSSRMQKKTYYICGALILVSAVMLYFDNGTAFPVLDKSLTSFFLWEVLAVIAFAVAWLVRSYEFRPS